MFDVVIPVYNNLQHVRPCINSLDKILPKNSKIYIIDDGSDEYVSNELKSICEELKVNSVYHRNKENIGYLKSCNYGISLGENPYVALVNSDTIIFNGTFEIIKKTFEDDPKIGIINPVSTWANWTRIPFPDGFDMNEIHDFVSTFSTSELVADINNASGFFLAVRRELFDNYGLFDEIFSPGYYEETDFCMRILENGYRVVVHKGLYVFHQGWVSFGYDKKKAYLEKNEIEFYIRWGNKFYSLKKDYINKDPIKDLKDALKNAVPPSSSRLKVIYVLQDIGVFGGVISVIQLVNQLNLLGISANIATYGKVNKNFLSRYPMYFRPYIFESKEDLIKNFPECDIVVATAWPTVYPVVEINKQHDIDMVYFVQDFEPDFHSPDSKLYKDALATYDMIPTIIVKSRWLKEKLKYFKGEIWQIPIGLNNDVFYDKNIDRPIHVISHARPVSERRNFPVIKEVFKQLKEMDESINLGVYGTNYSITDFDVPVHDFGVLNDAKEVADALNQSVILLDASKYQGFGRPGLEAMASGTATVLTRVGGITEYAKHKFNTLLVDPFNIDEIVQNILTLINNKDIRSKLVEKGFETVKNYDLRVEANLTKKLFENIKKNHKKNNINPFFKQYSPDQIDSILNALNSEKKISIIIPIYNSFEDVKKCLDSIVENTTIPYEMILINDSSTDNRIEILLKEMEFNHENVKVIQNLENLGFVKNINIGIKESGGDVVLLNSDTVVTAKWLQKLVTAAYSNEKIGTVTPFSNAAGAFSVPDIGEINEIPSNLKLEGIASLIEKISDNNYMEVPTGNGFCMFIKRDTIMDVGLFDEQNFGKGYGEENDFCMRAINHGWTNIIDDSTYIYHKRNASFSDQKEKLLNDHRAIIDKKYPDYTKKINDFISSDILLEMHKKIRSNLYNTEVDKISRKRILYVLHQTRGGTPNTNMDLMKNIQNSFECFVLTATGKELLLWKYDENKLKKIRYWNLKSEWSANNFYTKEFRDVYFNVLNGLKIDIVHIRHLFKHTFDLPNIAKQLGLPVILSFHDYYYICPSIHLLDGNNQYCGGICNESYGQCRIPMKILDRLPVLKTFKNKWQTEVSKVFDKCSSFVTTTEVAKKIYMRSYPKLADKTFKVIEHGRDFNRYNNNFNLNLNQPIKILFPGNIDIHKGSEFIKQLKIEDVNNNIEFHFIGTVTSELNDIGFYHGEYERDDFCKLVTEIKPTFIGIVSIWPETYCHTLSEAWSCGVPVLATKMGALEERIKNNGGGWFLDHENPSDSFNKIINIINSPEEYNKVNKEICNINIRSTKEMALEYKNLYKQNLKQFYKN